MAIDEHDRTPQRSPTRSGSREESVDRLGRGRRQNERQRADRPRDGLRQAWRERVKGRLQRPEITSG
jgi:hypothetical protein